MEVQEQLGPSDLIRAKYRARVPGGPILIRPSTHGFLETNEEDMEAACAEIDRLILRKELGIDPNPLEKMALRMLVEGW